MIFVSCISSFPIIPKVPILEDFNPIKFQICCKKFVVDVFPLVPVIAQTVSGELLKKIDEI